MHSLDAELGDGTPKITCTHLNTLKSWPWASLIIRKLQPNLMQGQDPLAPVRGRQQVLT